MAARGVRARIVALTGTPGTGKTTVAERLRERGTAVLALARYVGDPRFDEGPDPAAHGARIIDEAALSDHLLEHLADEMALPAHHAGPVVIESHFAHELAFVDQVIVLVTDPAVLGERLSSRDWPSSKVDANLAAEAQGVILDEARAHQAEAAAEGYRIRVDVVDTTQRVPEEVAEKVVRLMREPLSASSADADAEPGP